MNNSNGYILRYAAIMVIIAAALLSSAAMLLKPFQEKNMAIEKMGGILDAAGITDITTEKMIPSFNRFVKEEIVIDQDGNVVDKYDKKEGKEKARAFNLNLKEQYFNKSQGKPYELPLYVLDKKGETIYIIPLLGTGLWGPIWGNIALKDDLNTVAGVYFDHKGETPGLGAEITTKAFTDQFIGKKIFDKNGKFTSIEVVKGGAKTLPKDMQIHGVDAISGGTITSHGVNDMIRNNLESYLPYFEKLRKNR
jgi:Na+-transporting NADH:ubiquinone oxidoreductase subunit C